MGRWTKIAPIILVIAAAIAAGWAAAREFGPKTTFDFIYDCAELTANLFTSALGFAAVWAYFFRRKQLLQVFDVFTSSFFSQRIGQLKETLARLEQYNHDEKDDRKSIWILVAQIRSQLKALQDDLPELQKVLEDITYLTTNKRKMTDLKKVEMIYEIRTIVDTGNFNRQAESLKA